MLGRSAWQADTLRDLVRADVLATLGDAGGVLVVDETGFLKDGTHLRTSFPTPPFVVILLPLAERRLGRSSMQLYLPEAWANDAARRRSAAVPETVAFQTKPRPELSTATIHRLNSVAFISL